jgi:hypothetical protein
VKVESVRKAVVMGVGVVGEVADVEGVAMVAPGEVELPGAGQDWGAGEDGERVSGMGREVEFG